MSGFLLAVVLCMEPGATPITDRFFHLGDTKKPDWKDLTTVEPVHATQVEIEFDSRENKEKVILEIQAGSVSFEWKVRLNSKELGELKKAEPLTKQHFTVPPSALRDGKNKLTVLAGKEGDDIYVGKATLHEGPIEEVLGLARIDVSVRDGDGGQPLPCRLTITRKVEKEKGRTAEELVEVFARTPPDLAVRKGIVYAKGGLASIHVPPGKYTIHATRGFEYGLASAEVAVKRLEETAVELEIQREVDTAGLLAADTHIHTRTHSGHGDINLEERVVAIAGEGVEVAIATDHNHATDYGPTMEKVGVHGFASIIGDEVTTSIGHFNAFPLEKGSKPPAHDHSDWVKLVQAMRAAPGVRVVIINHPRRTLSKVSPFEEIRLNPLSGEAHRGPERLGVDAVEILNGKTLADDRMLTLRDWFGLLNRGYRMSAVAGSDSHSIDEIVGQARTYVASRTDDPRRARIDEICDAFLAGRLLVSLGLLVDIEVNGKHRTGDLAAPADGALEVRIRVQGPSWTRADKVALYLNGIEARKERLESGAAPVKFQAVWKVPSPPNDAHLVVVASGPPVTAPYWPIAGGGKKYVMGATNPVWIDADGDGRFSSAFEYASALLSGGDPGSDAAVEALAGRDAAVAAQYASIERARIQKEAQDAYDALMARADTELGALLGASHASVRKSFSDYLAAAPRVEIRTRRDREEEAARLKKEEDDRRKKREEERKREEEERKKKAEGRKGRV